MMLWTWQSFNFVPPFYPVDSSKSRFLIHSACPNIHLAYEELEELLALTPDRKNQFIWCYTVESWDEPWKNCCVWSIDVPQENILAYVDNPTWEHLIGSKSVPMNIREQWENVLHNKRISGDQFYEEMNEKERQYHDSFPSRQECLRVLLSPTQAGDNVTALLQVPIDVSWIHPYRLKKWKRQLKSRRTKNGFKSSNC